MTNRDEVVDTLQEVMQVQQQHWASLQHTAIPVPDQVNLLSELSSRKCGQGLGGGGDSGESTDLQGEGGGAPAVYGNSSSVPVSSPRSQIVANTSENV